MASLYHPIIVAEGFSMRHLTRFALAAVLVVAIAAPAPAQNEQALRAFFEGRRVTLKIDMPGSSDGVDVHVDAARALDYREYGDRLKEYGTDPLGRRSGRDAREAEEGSSSKSSLGGGGFGTFGDDTSTSVNIKGRREEQPRKGSRQVDQGRNRFAQQARARARARRAARSPRA